MKTVAALYLTGVAIGAMAVATPVFAQSEGAQAANADIIVTAQRRAERTQDVPISITAITGDALQQANVQQLGDIAKLSPATRFDYQANFVQPTIRGVGSSVVTSGGGSNVGIYMDGFYSPNPLANDFQLLSVQGIQVLKGPQGTLFGRNTTGGAILVSTAQPSHDLHGMAQVSYGRFDKVMAQGYVTGGLTDRIAADLEGSYSRGNGYVQNIVPGPDHPGKYENWSIRTGLKFDVSDKMSFLVRYIHQDVNDPTNVMAATLIQDGRIYAPFQGLPQQLPSALVPTGYRDVGITDRARPSFRFKGDIFQLTGNFDLGFGDLVSYTQYRHERSTLYTDNDQTAADIAFNIIPVNDKTFTQEFLLTSKPGGPLQWTTGLFYFNYIDAFGPIQIGTNPSTIFVIGNSHSRTQSIAAFVDATYEVVDNLFLTAGARYSHDVFDEGSFRLRVNGGPLLTNNSYPATINDRVTPRVVLRYAIDNHSSVYGSYTRGYKAALTDVIAGGQVKPEIMDAFEIGFKHASRKFSFNLASWYYNYRDLQVSVYEMNLSKILNAANARIYGVEGDVHYSVTPDFEVNASAAYVNAKYKQFPTSAQFQMCSDIATCGTNYGQFILYPIDGSGFRMQRAPEFTGTIGARYGLDLAGGRLALSANLYHTSSFYFDLAQQFRQDPYNLLGLRAEWTDPSDSLTLAVYGDNVTNEKYFTQVVAHSPGIGSVGGEPVSWGVSLRYKFGK
ncbi:MAG TPA: TonB-dependent receptor [Sphingobium sp.]|uniref:TonB-dependent receptor n=1 Tax=Sphingobium sp. TaxID=1912891 RepID=UPI002ED195A6